MNRFKTTCLSLSIIGLQALATPVYPHPSFRLPPGMIKAEVPAGGAYLAVAHIRIVKNTNNAAIPVDYSNVATLDISLQRTSEPSSKAEWFGGGVEFGGSFWEQYWWNSYKYIPVNDGNIAPSLISISIAEPSVNGNIMPSYSFTTQSKPRLPNDLPLSVNITLPASYSVKNQSADKGSPSVYASLMNGYESTSLDKTPFTLTGVKLSGSILSFIVRGFFTKNAPQTIGFRIILEKK